MTCFAAVDLGGQSGRVVLGRVHGGRLTYRELHRFANVPASVGLRWHWDVDALFEATLDGLRLAVRAAADLGDRLAGIGVDTWGVDYGLVTPDGDLAGPAVHHRSAAPDLVDQADALVPAAEAWSRTGIEKAAMNTSGRLAADARAGRLRLAPTALLTPDLWTFLLCGERGAERTIASTTELLDARTGDWALDLARRWGINPAVLPPVVSTGTQAGVTLPEVTRRIGADVPVAVYWVGSHDTASAVAAATSVAAAEGVISCGSWALAGCLADEATLSQAARRGGFTNERSADGRFLLLRNLSGLWLLESCLSGWAASSGAASSGAASSGAGFSGTGSSGTGKVEARTALLAAAEALPGTGLLVDVGDPVLRAPGDMPGRIAGLAGRELTRPETVRCILDSLAAAFADTLAAAAQLTGVPMRRVHLLGGGSRVAALARSTVRATGLPVVAGPGEATSIGNLMVQAVAAGAFDSLDDARDALDHGTDRPTILEPA